MILAPLLYHYAIIIRGFCVVTVEFLGPIGIDPIQLEAQSLRELKEKLQTQQELKSWLANCAVAVNDTLACDLDTKLNSGDRVSLLPPVCGG